MIESFYRLSEKQRFELMKRLWKRGDQEQFSLSIREMPYEQFLDTAYWKTVRDYVIWLANGRCGECHGKAFQVHHLTYENHGQEHLHLEDLMPVCGFCHQKIHGLKPPHAVKGWSTIEEIAVGWRTERELQS